MGVQPVRARRMSRREANEAPLFSGRAAHPMYVVPNLNVYQAALDRIRWLYDEFDGQVSVSTSGGKDSTVVVELALTVARERDRLPLRVMWLDQECEYAATVRYQRWMADREEIDFHWYQVPFKLFNATNHEDPWLRVWGEGEEWAREKEPDSIHENPFRRPDGSVVDRFKELLDYINKTMGGATLTGMRCEESPARRMYMTTNPAYKWATWSRRDKERKGSYYIFNPIYDWTFRDVWKSIYENGWTYNSHYDSQFRYGVPNRSMRVSNYHHETALLSLRYLQEVEPETWEAATRRLQGINTFGQLQEDVGVRELPFMFTDWDDYLEHLIENLVPEPEYRETFRRWRRKLDTSLPGCDKTKKARAVVNAVLKNDLYGTTIESFRLNHRDLSASAMRARDEMEEAFTMDEEVAR